MCSEKSAFAFSCGQVSQGYGEDAGTENIRDLHRQLQLARPVCFNVFGCLDALNCFENEMLSFIALIPHIFVIVSLLFFVARDV